jgi:hypothetical protein
LALSAAQSRVVAIVTSGVLRDQAQRGGLVAPRLAQRRPAVLVAALVFVDEGLRRLHRHMVGLETDVGEEGLAAAAARAQVVDGLVDEELDE